MKSLIGHSTTLVSPFQRLLSQLLVAKRSPRISPTLSAPTKAACATAQLVQLHRPALSTRPFIPEHSNQVKRRRPSYLQSGAGAISFRRIPDQADPQMGCCGSKAANSNLICSSAYQSFRSLATATEETQTQESVGLLSKLGQNWNSEGIRMFLEVASSKPELAVPHVSVPNIRWVDWEAVKSKGFRAAVFDKDNTITAPYSKTIHQQVTDSVEECKRVFPGKVALMSNSAGLLQYDRDGTIAESLQEAMGLPVIRHQEKKPAGSAAALERQLGCSAERIVFVGDRYFTDVLFGNRNGMFTIFSGPLEPHLDPFVVQRVRSVENALVERWIAQGVKAPLQAVFHGSHFEILKDPGCW